MELWASTHEPCELFLDQQVTLRRTFLRWEYDGWQCDPGASLPKEWFGQTLRASLPVFYLGSLCVICSAALSELLSSGPNIFFSYLKSSRKKNVLWIPAHRACFLLSNMQLARLCSGKPSIFLKSKLNGSFSVKASLLLLVHLPHLQFDHSVVLSLSLIMSCLVFGWGQDTDHPLGSRFHTQMRLKSFKCFNAQGKFNCSSKIQTDTQS